MASDWPIVRLGDVIETNLGKMLDAKKNKGEFKPYLGNSNVRWGLFELDNLAEMRFEDHEDERYRLRNGDLVICEGGEPGRCAIWRDELPEMRIQKALHRVRAKQGLTNHYLYYWINLAARTGVLEPYFTGTTIKHLTGRALAELRLPLPPMSVQMDVVDVLGAIDARIDNLRQTNVTLESIAQALFKSWFVDFDPVHAKAEGREPEGMDAATAALFPSEFEDSELGPIPKNWSIEGLGKISKNVREQAKPESLDPNTPYIGLEHMPKKSIALTDQGSAEGLASGKFWYRTSDILFGKLRPYFHKVGVATSDGVCSTDILVVRPVSPEWLGYTTMQFSSDAVISYATQLSNGAKMPRTNWSDLAKFRVALPPANIVEAFNNVIQPMISKIHVNIAVATNLADTRDTLLPRLISGKLRLPEAETITESTIQKELKIP